MNERPVNPQDTEPVAAPATPEPQAPESAPAEPNTPEPNTAEPVLPESAAPEAVAAETAPVKKRVRRGRIAAVAGAVLLAGAVVAGGAYTVVTVQDADRDAGAPSWKFPRTASDDGKASKPASSLAAMLVPYDPHLSRGPDIARFGTDAALNGGAATALRKESVRDLPRSQRRQIEKQIDKQHTKGIAMRSYLYVGSTAGGAGTYTAEIELAQIEDRKAVRNMSTFQNGFFDALEIFRSGPRIEGHKNAKCFLPPKDKEEELDMMICSGYQGDVLVSAIAYAAKPLNTKGVAQLFREQLDRIEEPGEAV
ncbi:hypothetical protein [Streptomyces sp. NPDC005141]